MNVMKRIELWQYLKESKPAHNKPPDAKAAMKLVCDKMEIVECDTILKTIRAEINYFRQFQEIKRKQIIMSEKKFLLLIRLFYEQQTTNEWSTPHLVLTYGGFNPSAPSNG